MGLTCPHLVLWLRSDGALLPGETLEEALHREVAEEVGLEVQDVSYSSSQHWPFPHSSFMVGCHATVSPAHTQVRLLPPRWWCCVGG